MNASCHEQTVGSWWKIKENLIASELITLLRILLISKRHSGFSFCLSVFKVKVLVRLFKAKVIVILMRNYFFFFANLYIFHQL